MLQDLVEVIRKGDERGNNMLLRFRTTSGVEIFGLPTENAHGGAWDLGPTWNYLVLTDRPFLVDTGKMGMGQRLLDMMESISLSGKNLDFITLTHGHEDHDGGLAELAATTGARIKAHEIYDRLIRYYPDLAPAHARPNFPAICWGCFMPESHWQNCLVYQQARSRLRIEPIVEGDASLGKEIDVFFVPGHNLDCLAFLVANDILIVGDTLLPDITPWPSQEAYFHNVREILSPDYTIPEHISGLRAYIRTLKRLEGLAKDHPNLVILPGHRLFYGNQWNEIKLEKRAHELIEHHITRSGDILQIIRKGPKTAREIALSYFEEHLLQGFGVFLAEQEVLSHCELLLASGDIVSSDNNRFAATGKMGFESLIEDLGREHEGKENSSIAYDSL